MIRLVEIVTSRGAHTAQGAKGSIYLVFEYMEHDLTGLCETPGVPMPLGAVKCYIKQLLNGLHCKWLFDSFAIHRGENCFSGAESAGA